MSVTIRVISKFVRPRGRSPICVTCNHNFLEKIHGNFRQNETCLGFFFSMTKFKEKKPVSQIFGNVNWICNAFEWYTAE